MGDVKLKTRFRRSTTGHHHVGRKIHHKGAKFEREKDYDSEGEDQRYDDFKHAKNVGEDDARDKSDRKFDKKHNPKRIAYLKQKESNSNAAAIRVARSRAPVEKMSELTTKSIYVERDALVYQEPGKLQPQRHTVPGIRSDNALMRFSSTSLTHSGILKRRSNKERTTIDVYA